MTDSSLSRSRCASVNAGTERSEEHTSELQSPCNLVCRLLLEKKKAAAHCEAIRPACFACPGYDWLIATKGINRLPPTGGIQTPVTLGTPAFSSCSQASAAFR